MTFPVERRGAIVNAGSPDPAAKSSTAHSGFIAAKESSASVIAWFQRTEASAQGSLTRARAAASHESRPVMPIKCKLFVGETKLGQRSTDSRLRRLIS